MSFQNPGDKGLRAPLARVRATAVLAWALALASCAAVTPAELTPRLLWPDHPGGVRDLCFDAGGTLLATAGADGVVRLWDTASAAPIGTLLAPLALDLRRVATNFYDRAVEKGMIDAEDFDELEVLPYERGLSRLALSPDGSRLALLVEDAKLAQLQMRELPGGQVRWTRWLSGWAADRGVDLFAVDGGVRTSVEAPSESTPIRFSDLDPARHAADSDVVLRFEPDGATVWVGPQPAPAGPLAEAAGVRVEAVGARWRAVVSEREIDLGPRRDVAPRGVALSADGRWLAIGDRFGAIRLWDLSQPSSR